MKKKRGIGVMFVTIGGIGIILGTLLGFSDLDRPWSFLMGFLLGVIAGIGVVLSISGLLERRKSER